jgi:hypothetical protein
VVSDRPIVTCCKSMVPVSGPPVGSIWGYRKAVPLLCLFMGLSECGGNVSLASVPSGSTWTSYIVLLEREDHQPDAPSLLLRRVLIVRAVYNQDKLFGSGFVFLESMDQWVFEISLLVQSFFEFVVNVCHCLG